MVAGNVFWVRVKEIDVSLENHMSNSPIWDMNRLWEDKMLEDWRVLESSVAESGKRNREVPGIGTALVVSEVDELV
ncbi:hypothetical protein V6N12_067862 [Hibiscus sabdariffa]|uniref:Uncharacterized protein n=1 Tax=Hibiscus sabdariffa TaxID=183260 RepID=A0ABR2FNE5_9ROSI